MVKGIFLDLHRETSHLSSRGYGDLGLGHPVYDLQWISADHVHVGSACCLLHSSKCLREEHRWYDHLSTACSHKCDGVAAGRLTAASSWHSMLGCVPVRKVRIDPVRLYD